MSKRKQPGFPTPPMPPLSTFIAQSIASLVKQSEAAEDPINILRQIKDISTMM